MTHSLLAASFFSVLAATTMTHASEPVRVGVVRLTHDHVFWILNGHHDRDDIQIVGVYEPNEDLARRRAERFGLDPSILFTDLGEMLAAVEPEAVCHFGSTREHREDAIRCARAGAHVMVEKPLALTHADGVAMAAAARRAGVHLLTNLETTWYPAHTELRKRLDTGQLGPIRRLVFRTGHRGPVEIGCRPEFLAWLLDPVENGGGAVTDFGCYGANLATWLMNGHAPDSVWATTQTLKPDTYPNVDDDATIVLNYNDAVAVLQPSWNWPASLKETAVFCQRAELTTLGRDGLRIAARGADRETLRDLAPLTGAEADPFAHLAAVVREEAKPNALSSIENNLTVMRILDAARESAQTGERIRLE